MVKTAMTTTDVSCLWALRLEGPPIPSVAGEEGQMVYGMLRLLSSVGTITMPKEICFPDNSR
jgi:hypothetical protein